MKEAVVFQDWRLRVQWNPLGARTGRWTTKGLNAQNWFKTILVNIREGQVHPADMHLLESMTDTWMRIPGIRQVVRAPKGRKIVGADSSQAEIRAVAALSGETKLIEILARGDAKTAELKAAGRKDEAKLLKFEPRYDVHSYVAAEAFGAAYVNADYRTKHGLEVRDRLRDLVKRVIYGMNYGAGADTILEAIYDGGYEGPPLTEEDISKLMTAYFKAFPRIRVWREEVAAEARRTGRIWDALIRRRREFPLGPKYNLVPITEAYNFAIQSTCASMINMAMWEFRQALPLIDHTARLLAQVHDAIYVECDEDKAEAVARLLEQCMSQELQLVPGAPYMQFPATAKIGDDWYQVG
jgi:DNA polymerase-1